MMPLDEALHSAEETGAPIDSVPHCLINYRALIRESSKTRDWLLERGADLNCRDPLEHGDSEWARPRHARAPHSSDRIPTRRLFSSARTGRPDCTRDRTLLIVCFIILRGKGLRQSCRSGTPVYENRAEKRRT